MAEIAALPEAWWGERLLLSEVSRWDVDDLWQSPRALLLRVLRDGELSLFGVGDGAELAELVRAYRPGPRLARASVARGAAALLARPEITRLGLDVSTTWDWMWADTQPPLGLGDHADGLVREGDVALLDPSADAAQIRATLVAANPRSTADPHTPGSRWWGWWTEGRLGGVICAQRRGTTPDGGVPWHLKGLAVLPVSQGRGGGTALTAAATRAGLSDAPWVSLALYADNDRARQVYLRLGYRIGGELATFRPPA